MRVYLAAAMTSPATEPAVIRAVLDAIEHAGHEVPTRHVATPLGKDQDAALAPAELARRDLGWVASCDCLVAEVSTPSHGVGIEVMAARQAGIPVLLLHRRDAPVSRLLVGLDGTEVVPFAGPGEAEAAVLAFLERCPRQAPGFTPSSHG